MREKVSAEDRVREIRRKTRKKYSSEEKVRIVLEGLQGSQADFYLSGADSGAKRFAPPSWDPSGCPTLRCSTGNGVYSPH